MAYRIDSNQICECGHLLDHHAKSNISHTRGPCLAKICPHECETFRPISATVETPPPDFDLDTAATERAAQIWCEPQHAYQQFDSTLAESIVKALKEFYAKGKIAGKGKRVPDESI